MKDILAKYNERISGKFLQHYDESPLFEKKRARAFFVISSMALAVLSIGILYILPPSTARQFQMVIIFSVLIGGHIISLAALKFGRYVLSVDSLLWLYTLCWCAASLFGRDDFIGTGINEALHLVFVIISLAGLFGSMATFGATTVFLLAGAAVHAAVSYYHSNFIVFLTVRSQMIGLGVAMAGVFLIFLVIRRALEGAFLSSEDELVKNLNIMHALEDTISRQTNQLLKEKNTLKELNREYELELTMACKIQKKLIPSESPADYIHIFYKPMKQVGGDFFDFLRFRNSSKIGIFVSDVAGHGIPAAFITSMVKSFILQSGAMRENPADLLYYLNNLLINQTADYFVTAFYGIYDPATRHFVFANSGHNPPFLIYKDRVDVVEGKASLPLAVFDNKEMRNLNIEIVNNEIVIPENCTLLLYTDGLVEERNASNLQFQHGPMIEAILESRKIHGDGFIKNLYQHLVDFSGSDMFYDDICLIYLDLAYD